MILDNELLTTVRTYFSKLERPVTLALQPGDHEKRAELVSFLEQLASTSDKLQLGVADGLRSPLSFRLEVAGQPSGIVFSGLPGGHEFSSLILAILQAGQGSPIKLDPAIQNLVKHIKQPLPFITFVSLSCHNCPDVVQTLNQFALLNPLISNEMVDGGLFPAEIERLNIQGVPAVFLDGAPFANGKIDTAKLVEKLLERYPDLNQGVAQEALPLQDVLVIGGGPAGASAAIYCARKGLKVTVVADRIGGQVKDTVDIENLIGTTKTTGSQLAQNLQAHLQAYPINVRENLQVQEVMAAGKNYQVRLNSGETLETRTVIVASGAKWRELGVPGERENIGNGVAFCPHCDGPFFKDKDIAVVGGGNSGVEAALDLAAIVKSVTLFEFMPELKADKVLVEQLAKRPNIKVITSAAVQEIRSSNGKVSQIAYRERETNQLQTVDLSGVFVQIGLVPNADFLGDLVEKTKFGEIVINAKCETSRPGIYAAGDVSTVPYKQIVIAMGEGAKAGLSAFDYLLRQ